MYTLLIQVAHAWPETNLLWVQDKYPGFDGSKLVPSSYTQAEHKVLVETLMASVVGQKEVTLGDKAPIKVSDLLSYSVFGKDYKGRSTKFKFLLELAKNTIDAKAPSQDFRDAC